MQAPGGIIVALAEELSSSVARGVQDDAGSATDAVSSLKECHAKTDVEDVDLDGRLLRGLRSGWPSEVVIRYR